MISVCIDGFMGAGKSALAKTCAKKLNFVYMAVDTIFKAVVYYCKKMRLDITNPDVVEQALGSMPVLTFSKGEHTVFMGREDITSYLDEPDIFMAISGVAAFSGVRTFRNRVITDTMNTNHLILDTGHCGGDPDLPESNIRIFLTARPEVRARRSQHKMIEHGSLPTFEQILDNLNTADQQCYRYSPYAMDGVTLLDTTFMDFDSAVRAAIEIIKRNI